MTNAKLGDTIYRFDINRRKYNGAGMSSRIIYAEHFEGYDIAGETKQSWLLKNGWREFKVNKKTLHEAGKNGWGGHQWYTRDGMDGQIWLHEHRHQIIRKLEQATLEQLRKVAEVVGYEAQKAATAND